MRDRCEPRVLRSPRSALPILDLPKGAKDGDAARRAASTLLSAILPAPQRMLLELAASGERVLGYAA